MIKSKRAQRDGAAVAILIIVIALFMTLYILFIPPEDRNQILQPNNESNSSSSSSDKIELLAEAPGLVTPTTQTAAIHRIPSINLFLRDEPKIINLAQSLVVENGLFSKTSPQLKFKAEDLSNTKKVTFFFSVQKSSGELKLKFNGNTVYAEEITTPGIKFVEIAKSFITTDNTLELSVSNGFFGANKYELKDIGIKQEFELKNNEESRTFVVPVAEKNFLKTVTLKYTQQCNFPLTKETTHLDILVNEQRAYDAEIRCITTDEEIEIDPTLLVAGTNSLAFRLESGDFSFNIMKLETKSTGGDRPTFYFTITEDQYNDIKSSERNIGLKLLLEQNKKSKNGRIIINNNEILMQTDQSSFEKNLKDYITEGTNFIKIVPGNSFSILSLKVTLE